MIDQLNIEFKVFSRGHDLNERRPLDVTLNLWTNAQSRWYVGFGLRSLWLYVLEIINCRSHTFYINGLFDFKMNFLPLLLGKKFIIAPRGMLQKGALENGILKKRVYLMFLSFIMSKKDVKWHATDLTEVSDITDVFGLQEVIPISNLIKEPSSSDLVSNKISGQLRLVYFSLITEKKNLLFLLECMLSIPLDIQLDIVGPIKDVTYYGRCQDYVDQHYSLKDKVVFKGPAESDFLSLNANNYDYFVLPTKGENFGHAIVESLANGLPVIISPSTPWKFDNVQSLFSLELSQEIWIQTLIKLVHLTSSQHQSAREEALKYFNFYIGSQNEYTKLSYLQLFSR